MCAVTDERVDGCLVVAGVPIGNVADASPRLAAELTGADIVAAEGTRRLRPGYRLVAAAAAGIPVTTVPGSSAVTAAARGVRARDRPVLLRGLPAAAGAKRTGAADRGTDV
jgi:16S rRNA C1402 (ribose-2'-O) methylase RsmI